MNKRQLCTALLAVCGAAVLVSPAFAQTSSNAPPSQPAATTASNGQVAARSSQQNAKRAVPPLDSRMCIRDTGSHIPAPKGQCLPVAGNSYNRQDIQRTGATNMGQALQMLDPSVTTNGH